MTSSLDRRAHQLVTLGAGDPDQLLTDAQLAAWFGVNEQWPAQQRHCVHTGKLDPGDAPPFIALSPRRLRYRRGTVVEWLMGRMVGGDSGRLRNVSVTTGIREPPGRPPHLRLVETPKRVPSTPELVAAIRAAPAPQLQRFRRGN